MKTMHWIIVSIIICVAGLVALGLVTIHSISMVLVNSNRMAQQLRWLGLGLVLATALALCPYEWLKRPWVPTALLGLAFLSLIAVLIPGVGQERNGGQRWLYLGQPSEFAKIAIIVALAYYGASRQDLMQERKRGFFYPGFIVLLVVAFIFREPDWGTAILLASVSGMMLFIAGVPWFYMLSAGIMGAEVVGLFICNNALRMTRILAFLEPEKYKHGIGWQSCESMIAIGSGGLFGLGWAQGLLKFGFVPENETDFVLSVIGEELGFIGTTLVVLAYAWLVLAGIYIAWKEQDWFGQLLAVGITFLIGLQSFINIGVATSSLPNKGIPLPFVSYGGSDLLCMLICVGLLISIARFAPQSPPQD